MPIYEYSCKQCGHPFEALVNGSAKAKCPECNSRRLEKKLSVFAAVEKERFPRMENPGPPASCGSCGDPRGPGACSMN